MNTITRSFIFMLIFLRTTVFLAEAQIEYKIPELAKPGKGAYEMGELIYSLDNKPTPECHASSIVEVDDGLIAAWFGGTRERHKDVGIWVSMNLDGSWSKPVEVINGFVNDTLRYPCWNPVLFQAKNGSLMLFYKVGPNPRDWWGMLSTSENKGRTWSEPVKLGECNRIGHLLGPVKNKAIQLEDGTLICPSSSERTKEGEDFWRVHFEVSNDMGKTWEVIGPINDGVEFDAIQPSILTYEGGKMQVLCRSMQDVIVQSWSADGGKSWSSVSATDLPNPSSGTDAVTLADGRQLLVYNHSERRKRFPQGRNMLNVAISSDGKNWRPVMTLERQKGEYSYPAVIQSKDGKVHITYTFRRKTIKYIRLDPDLLN